MDDLMENRDSKAKIIWILYAVSIFVGITSVIGLILAYVWRGEEAGTPMASHYDKQIQVFWYSVIASVVAFILFIVGTGGAFVLMIIAGVLFLAAALYFVIMTIIGLVKSLDDKPWH